MGDLVRTSGSDLGFVFDPDGETATIIDDQGTALDPEQALLVLVELVCRSHARRAHRACRSSVSREAERIAERHGAPIVWTKLSAAHLMEVAGSGAASTSRRRRRAGSSGPTFLPAYDAAATLVHLLDLLARDRPAAVGDRRRSCPSRTSRTRPCRRRGSARAR